LSVFQLFLFTNYNRDLVINMSGELYNMCHLMGGFILTILFFVVFTANIIMQPKGTDINVIGSLNVNPSYFMVTFMVGIALSMLLYVLKINEYIYLQKKIITQGDNFDIKNCPPGFKKALSDKGKNIRCESIDPGNPVPNFFLDGNNSQCAHDMREENGCFNRYPTRFRKCNNLRDYFKIHTQMLDTWTDFRDNCTF
jgi:hypothetical protein